MNNSEPSRPPDGRDVCAIVVTYHPDSEVPDRIDRILRQVGALVIVDNGSCDVEVTKLRVLAANPSITLVLNSDNLGIARALNIGIQRAVALGFTWALLLDQDSNIDDDMVQTLLSVHAAFPDRDRLAVIGAGFRDINMPLEEPSGETRDDGWEKGDAVITSGSL